MAPITNERVLFAKIPKGEPVPGEHLVVDKSETIDLDAELGAGEILVKTLVLSLDPYLRGKMRDASKASYTPAFELNKPIINFGVVEVIKSNQEAYPAGVKLYGIFAFKQYDIVKEPDTKTLGASGAWRIIKNEENLPWSAWVGACGMPGKTAYYGFKALSHSKPGESVFVSSAYGPVGQLVCQIAKASGCHVIASAGSDEKVEFVKSLGVDSAFNYKKVDTAKALADFGKPIDIFWDGVGGATLDAWLGAANRGGRSIECGMIAGYNGGEPYPLKNIMMLIGKGLNMRGFLVSEFESMADEFYANVPKSLADGTYKSAEEVRDGLESTPQAFSDMLSGLNKGKVVIKVADPTKSHL